MSTQPVSFLTPEEYLEIERAAEFRSEYLNGQMFAMSGGTVNHGRIVRNTLIQFTRQMDGGCEAVCNDLRLFSAQYQIYTYPDVVVACGPYRYLDDRRDTIVDATLVVEVLSPSTRNYDRGEKFLFYRSLPSFSEYLVLWQDAMRAEHHVRQVDGSWLMREYMSASDIIELPAISCRLPLEQLYERVEFESKTQA